MAPLKGLQVLDLENDAFEPTDVLDAKLAASVDLPLLRTLSMYLTHSRTNLSSPASIALLSVLATPHPIHLDMGSTSFETVHEAINNLTPIFATLRGFRSCRTPSRTLSIWDSGIRALKSLQAVESLYIDAPTRSERVGNNLVTTIDVDFTPALVTLSTLRHLKLGLEGVEFRAEEIMAIVDGMSLATFGILASRRWDGREGRTYVEEWDAQEREDLRSVALGRGVRLNFEGYNW